MTCTEAKPTNAPYYYRVRGITPTPGNDWICENGVWVWRMSGQEKGQEPDATERFEEQFVVCKNPEGFFKVNEKYVQVCKDLRGYYYIENFQRYSLSLSWVTENIIKKKLKDLAPKEDPATTLLRDPESGKWFGGDVGKTLTAPFEKAAKSLQDLGGGVKGTIASVGLVLMLFVAVLVYLVFVRGKGASGVTVGQVG